MSLGIEWLPAEELLFYVFWKNSLEIITLDRFIPLNKILNNWIFHAKFGEPFYQLVIKLRVALITYLL